MKPFELTVWGARGSISAPAADNARFGSDTSCMELRLGDRTILLDAGTGIIGCGRKLFGEKTGRFDLLLTHCHFDHIIGLPFIIPLYKDWASVRVFAGHFHDQTTCRNMVERFMCPPYFPVTPKQFAAKIDYCDFRPPEILDLGDGIVARTMLLNHPDGAVAYRIEFDGRVLSYVTDTEHEPGELDQNIVAFIAGSQLVIYDSTYTDEDFERYRGFGHSTWQEGVRLCEAAGVENLMIHHHDISRNDASLEALAQEVKEAFTGALIAGTGLRIAIEPSAIQVLQDL